MSHRNELTTQHSPHEGIPNPAPRPLDTENLPVINENTLTHRTGATSEDRESFIRQR